MTYKVKYNQPIIYFLRTLIYQDIQFAESNECDDYFNDYSYHLDDRCVKLQIYQSKLLRTMYGFEN